MSSIWKSVLTVIIAAGLGSAGSLQSRGEEAQKPAAPPAKVRRVYSRTVTLSEPPPISLPKLEEESTPAVRKLKSLPAPEDFRPAPISPPPALPELPVAPRKKTDETDNWILPPAPADLPQRSRPLHRGWGWLADSVLELQQQEEETRTTEEELEQDELGQPPLLSPSGLRMEAPGPASVTDITGVPEPFQPVSELGFLPEVRITNQTSLIGRADDLARESPGIPAAHADRTESETPRFNQMLESEIQAAIQQDVSDSLPYQAARIPSSRPRLSATEEMLQETKVTLFGENIAEPERKSAQLPAVRPTSDFQPSAFSQFTRYEPASEPELFKKAPGLSVSGGSVSPAPGGAFSAGGLMLNRSSITISPGTGGTPPLGRIAQPFTRSAGPAGKTETHSSPLQPSSGSKLIDRFLTAPGSGLD